MYYTFLCDITSNFTAAHYAIWTKIYEKEQKNPQTRYKHLLAGLLQSSWIGPHPKDLLAATQPTNPGDLGGRPPSPAAADSTAPSPAARRTILPLLVTSTGAQTPLKPTGGVPVASLENGVPTAIQTAAKIPA